ncbi:Dabb family protein [Devosia sp.]|uniref:Dabb family protein n=1 Tax=Devosia sp. TaxID=1871048 RepID=UPI003A8E2001
MIRHIVLVKFRADVTADARAAIFGDLAALRDHLPGIVAMQFGANVSPEGKSLGFEHGFVIDFGDAAARDAYLVDPAHKAAGAQMVAALEGGRDSGLIVFDIAI